MTERLTVVIPATDQRATLGGVLLSVAAAEEPAEEVIVIETHGAGPAAARNEGAERAEGDILVFVDSDVEVHPDALGRIREAFRADPDLTAVFGSYDDRPPTAGTVSRFRNLLHHHIHQEGAGRITTFWAGLGAIRRDAFLAAGGFDSARYPGSTGMEDIELGMRVSGAGGRIVLDPMLRGTHMKSWPVARMVSTDFWRRGIPWARLLLRRRELSTALNLGWQHRISALLSVELALSLARKRRTRATGVLAGFLALNRRFHLLLWRRGGARTAIPGVPLHLLHHLTAVAAVTAACGLELFGWLRHSEAREDGSFPWDPTHDDEGDANERAQGRTGDGEPVRAAAGGGSRDR